MFDVDRWVVHRSTDRYFRHMASILTCAPQRRLARLPMLPRAALSMPQASRQAWPAARSLRMSE